MQLVLRRVLCGVQRTSNTLTHAFGSHQHFQYFQSFHTQATSQITSTTKNLADGVCEGHRTALARAITLVESVNPARHQQAQLMLSQILQHSTKAGNIERPTVRIGISGPPGVGKSTFIEAFGSFLLNSLGKRLAVLTIDPSSTLTRGSILGDKTRMPTLSSDKRAFVRPSPSGGTLGGVARNTSDTITLVEAAGFDVVLVETVGVGQNEIAVAEMVDLFMLLLPPAGGDELQGIKRGIMELADIVVINKADGDLVRAARMASIEYTSALKFMKQRHTGWRAPVLQTSAKEHTGLDAVWENITGFYDTLGTEAVQAHRAAQYKAWMWRYVEQQLMQQFRTDPRMNTAIVEAEEQLSKKMLTPRAAADTLLAQYSCR
eukprot:m.321485 g.321485  ORF g.321485 m.321485 type:complete len:376 (-) comp15998_c0_seq2:2368-3495(-)